MYELNLADAFDQLFRNHYSVLVLFARKLIQDRPAAEDIVSEVFCKLWERQLRFATPESAKAFLYISTRNACINFLQRGELHAGIREKIGKANANGYEDYALNHMISTEVSRQLIRYVDALPAECRRIMRMSFLEGIPNCEIAKKLQLSVNTVRNQKARGIHLIRKRILPQDRLRA